MSGYKATTHLLLEVPPLFFVNEYQVEIVPHTELLVDVLHRGREVVAGEEESDGNGLPSHWSSVHNLIFGYLLIFSIDVGSCVCRV